MTNKIIPRFSRYFLKAYDMLDSKSRVGTEKNSLGFGDDNARQLRWIFFSEWSSNILHSGVTSYNKLLLTRSFNLQTRG